jgi:hypothetical protein
LQLVLPPWLPLQPVAGQHSAWLLASWPLVQQLLQLLLLVLCLLLLLQLGQ